ncbi:P-loop containing nucleoside triphosphate hydrolase protein [Fomitiporia mediterranea MF3/22]|uniref:P-loop containing nucleoside triphosphate hydrolase protein n=1 Tax=Fomitiporia mediterranea (strain MF3/22) TaxID=694068 RepID=UPI00044087D1|nr:P-loop containing nucleoside triphosphate hydrolase protein [Fomitiporia mediterranea MF3/22]EJC99752.1 P-loop containing nucleoside triphosphate hydrolase protein [Fomitiporia mediterranea MF3/22]
MNKICPNVRAERTCNIHGCSLIHTVYRCSVCRAPFASQSACRQHEASKAQAHRRAYSCALCSVLSLNQADYEDHMRGRKHKAKSAAAQSQAKTPPAETTVPDNHRHCDVCSTFVHNKLWAQHAKGKRHRSRVACQVLTNSSHKTEVDKYGVQLDCDIVNFGFIDKTSETTTSTKDVKIMNRSFFTIDLVEAKLTSCVRADVFQVTDATRRRSITCTNSTNIKIQLSVRKQQRGNFESRLELCFEIPAQNRRFVITRLITARVGSEFDHETLKATESYIPRKKNGRPRITRFIPGIRPPYLTNIRWAKKLGKFNQPGGLIEAAFAEGIGIKDRVNATRSSFMPGTFREKQYSRHLQTMLWIEEEQARQELSGYDMENVKLIPQGKLFKLQIPGLAEKRPSVLRGDSIFAVLSNSSSTPYQGFVYDVQDKFVFIYFNKKFKVEANATYNVHFDLNRLVFRRMHQALTCPTFSSRAAFPDPAQELKTVSHVLVESLELFNAKVAENHSQRHAVASILYMPAGSVPFIVFGPPGTGKTVTIVEAIRQIISRNQNARILACAPSNSAADTLTERLSALKENELIRLVAPSRTESCIPKNVLKFTHRNSDGIFVCPTVQELKTFRVIVSTCCNASTLYGMGVEAGHFSHIFVDEAAQGIEPEIMIPIRTMLGPQTNVICSGDIKQLGPIVRSPVARELGLSMSYLERLMLTSMYNEDASKGKSMVKLTKNYRSHPAILDFPNRKFYKNELEACARREISHSIASRWDGLINKDFPIIFHSTCGQDEREASSPSYFNIDEASLVRDYVRSLLSVGALRLNPEDIGVITPYRAQVRKVRQLLGTFARETRVGSVEEFQGQERRVIIISTVRSSRDMISYDLRHTLGFVANPRRFNVAVTRAQALLIVIGDPFVLALDPLWKEFINYVYLGGGYTGEDFDWDPTEPVDSSTKADEERRAQGLTELENLVRRISEVDLADDGGHEDAAVFREED